MYAHEFWLRIDKYYTMTARTELSQNGIYFLHTDDATDKLNTAGFSKLSAQERYQRLLNAGVLTPEDLIALQNGNMLPLETAQTMIENNIGRMELPMGVAVGVPINGREYVVPMPVEETSIIAAVCKTSKLIREHGEATAEVLGHDITGQIQFPVASNFPEASARIAQFSDQLITEANEHVVPSMVARGGGVTGIEVRHIGRPDGKNMLVVHVHMNAGDAMGANSITQVCEFLRGPLEDIIQEKSNMCIVSNLSERRLVLSSVALHDIEPAIAQGIEEASLFAQLDPHRAATHNKGIMNGIDPILIATGNDWRAVEAGAHAYAARDGQYRGLSTWTSFEDDNGRRSLYGKMIIPMSIGTVGGATRIHPTAQMSLRMMGVQSSDDLAKIASTVGLIQNLGALHALTTDGLVKGHMRLHIANIIAETDAAPYEKAVLTMRLREFLEAQGKVTVTDAQSVLQKMRTPIHQNGHNGNGHHS